MTGPPVLLPPRPRPGDVRAPDVLYDLLPALYRARDRDGALRVFLALFARELAHVRGGIDQLLRDLHIDTCQDWVIPYLGDLVGADLLAREGALQRAEVRGTVAWRRRKGTLAAIEAATAESTAWGVVAVEMRDRLVWSQHLAHLRPHALHALRIDDGGTLARLETPFDATHRSVDLRAPDQRIGRHHLPHVAVWGFAIASHAWAGARPARVDATRWRLHPLGVDMPLHAGGDRGDLCDDVPATLRRRADICWPRADHVPIRTRDLAEFPHRYVNVPSGFALREDGIPLLGTGVPTPSRSQRASLDFAELATDGGILAADPSLFGAGAARFRVSAVRLRARMNVVNGVPVPATYSPVEAFGNNFTLDPARIQGALTVPGFAYAAGTPFNSGAPDHEHPVLLLRIERIAAGPGLPECELVVRNADARALLVFVPALATATIGDEWYLYVADDGSTYFARSTHDVGPANLNPDTAQSGAYLPGHLARAALGQVRPRPGVRPVTWRRVVARDLCCWDHGPQPPLAAGEVAVDPTRGRVRFPAGEGPTGTLTADFRFARTGAIGAAPAFRGPGTTPTRTVALEGRADFRRIQDAIDATIGQVDRVVIEILDSGTYAEALVVSGAYPGGLELRATRTARAALATIPCVLATGGPALHVQPGASVGGTGLVLEGLVLAGGDVRIEGTLAALEVRACTLAHDTVTVAIAPAAALPAATLAGVLAGRVTATARVTTLAVRDAVLHHPAVTIERPELVVALAAVGRVTLDRVTVLGALAAQTLDASDALLLGPPQPVDGDASCARFSRLPALGALRSYRCTTAMPVFVSLRPADAGYAHLHPNTHGALRRGGEEGGEIGAFHAAGVPWREQSLAHRVDEFLPAGLRAVPVRALPPVRFAGVITP